MLGGRMGFLEGVVVGRLERSGVRVCRAATKAEGNGTAEPKKKVVMKRKKAADLGFVESNGTKGTKSKGAEATGGADSAGSYVYRSDQPADRGTVAPTRPRALLAVPVTASGFGPMITAEELAGSLVTSEDPLWTLIQREAQVGAANEQFLASELYASVLQHQRLEDAVSVVLGNKLGTGYMQATQWMELFADVAKCCPEYRRCLRLDMMAVMERDPAARHAVGVLLYAKGFHAILCHRLSHYMWQAGKVHMAMYLQSMISQRFGLDIHPAARIGGGIFMDHATGIVIGETAVVGENVSMLHNVTLGGTGKESGDRHPKIEDGVLIGAGTSILGNIRIGRGSKIYARSVVTKPCEPFTIVSGVPGKPVGKLPPFQGPYPSKLMDHSMTKELQGMMTDMDDGVGI